jgi:murein DD-endopeptidase MepM/ murein hydrolase activator NlpD
MRTGGLVLLLAVVFGIGLGGGLGFQEMKERGRVERLGGVMGDVRLLEAKMLAAMIVGRGEKVIGERGSLAATLTALTGLTGAAVEPWIHALGTVFDVRDLQAEDTIVVEMAGVGGLHRMELKRSAAERYEVVRDAQSGLGARQLEIATERRFRRVAGTVNRSLSEAVIAAGGDSEIIAALSDLFAYDIDFVSDVRPGDTFDILIEETWVADEQIAEGEVLMARYEGERAAQSAYRYIDQSGHREWYTAGGASLRKSLLKSPLNYRRITSHFSERRLHPIRKTYCAHLGVDFAAPRGTPVVSVGEGTIAFAGYKGANGNLVIIRHPGGRETDYLHLQSITAGLRAGMKVAQGQVIGTVGATGAATGPHLHFQVRDKGRFVDPLKFASPPGRPVPSAERVAFHAERRKWETLTFALAPGMAVPAGEIDRLASHAGQIAHAMAVARYSGPPNTL